MISLIDIEFGYIGIKSSNALILIKDVLYPFLTLMVGYVFGKGLKKREKQKSIISYSAPPSGDFLMLCMMTYPIGNVRITFWRKLWKIYVSYTNI